MNKLYGIISGLLLFVSCHSTQSVTPKPVFSKTDSLEIVRLSTIIDQIQYSNPDSAIKLQFGKKHIFDKYAYAFGIIHYYNATCFIYCTIKQDLVKGKVYADSGWLYAQEPQNEHLLYRAYYGYGIYYMYKGDMDSASAYFLRALASQPEVRDNNFYENTHSFLSEIFASQGNFVSAFNYYQPLIEIAEQESTSTYSTVFYLSGYAYAMEIKDKDSIAYSYLSKAHSLAKKLNYTAMNSAIYTSLAEYYQKKKKSDSSILYAQKAIETINANPQSFDKIEKPYIILLNNYCATGNYAKASLALQDAKSKIDTSRMWKDDLIRLLEAEYTIYQNTHEPDNAFATLRVLNKLQAENFKSAKNDQLLRHEKELKKLAAEKTILKKNIEIKRQKIYNYILIGTLILLTIIVVFVYNEIQKRRKIQRLKSLQIQQEMELQQEKELLRMQIEERNRISQEMHDDLGSTLTTVQMGLNLLQTEPGSGQYLQIIDKATSTLGQQINDAIWNLNVRNDYLFSLIGYFNKFAHEFLTGTTIRLHLNQEKVENDFPLSGKTRRGLYLTLKELLNNIVKYAEAKNVYIDFEFNGSLLTIKIKDDGVGFTEELLQLQAGKGNGLINIQATIEQLGGTIQWENKNGMETVIQLSLV